MNVEAELRLRLDTEAGASPMPTGVTHRALVVEPVGDAVALAELEKYNPLQGRTAEAGGRALRRWVEDLAGDPRTAGLVTKTGGRLYVARAAVLPIGLPSESVTVGEFLATATGELPREVFGVAVPSTLGFQYAHWPERKRQRFLDRLELGKRLDEHNAKCAGLRTTREGRREADRLFCAANAEWAKAHSLAGSARSVREALGKIKAGIDPDARGRPRGDDDGAETSFSPDAQAFFRVQLTGTQLRVATIYRSAVALADQHGWTLPALRSVQRWAKANFPPSILDYHRLGPRKWAARHAPYIERDAAAQYRPNQC